MPEMILNPKFSRTSKKKKIILTACNLKERSVSQGSLEIFLFMKITNFLTVLWFILAVFKYEYLKSAAT